MRIAYWTIDEVNLSLARDLADLHDATIDQATTKDKDPTRDADAVLYDLDALAPTMREDVLSRLVLSPLLLPVAVHGYNLDDSQIELLAAHGITAFRHLEAEVFGNLRAAILTSSQRTGDCLSKEYRRASLPSTVDQCCATEAAAEAGC
jgi:hypothetical protein